MGFFAERKKKKQEMERNKLRVGAFVDAKIAFERGDYATAAEKYRLSSEYGDTQATYILARELESGQHMEKDLAQAQVLYEKCIGTEYECSALVALYRILRNPCYPGHNEDAAKDHLRKAIDYEKRHNIFVYGAHYENALILAKKGHKGGAAIDLDSAFHIDPDIRPYDLGLERLKQDIRTYDLPITVGMLAYMTTQGDERASELFIPLFLESSAPTMRRVQYYEKFSGVYTNLYLHYLLGQRYIKAFRYCSSEIERETYYDIFAYHCIALEDGLAVSYSEMCKLKPGLHEVAKEIRQKTYTGRQYLSIFDGPAPRPKFR